MYAANFVCGRNYACSTDHIHAPVTCACKLHVTHCMPVTHSMCAVVDVHAVQISTHYIWEDRRWLQNTALLVRIDTNCTMLETAIGSLMFARLFQPKALMKITRIALQHSGYTDSVGMHTDVWLRGGEHAKLICECNAHRVALPYNPFTARNGVSSIHPQHSQYAYSCGVPVTA